MHARSIQHFCHHLQACRWHIPLTQLVFRRHCIFHASPLHTPCFSHLVPKAPMEWSKYARPSLLFLPPSLPLAPSIHHYPHRHKITFPPCDSPFPGLPTRVPVVNGP